MVVVVVVVVCVCQIKWKMCLLHSVFPVLFSLVAGHVKSYYNPKIFFYWVSCHIMKFYFSQVEWEKYVLLFWNFSFWSQDKDCC